MSAPQSSQQGYEDEDDDIGLFSYNRPSTATNPPAVPRPVAFPSTPPGKHIEFHHSPTSTLAVDNGPRRRGGYAYPESPGVAKPDPFHQDQIQQQTNEGYASSEGSDYKTRGGRSRGSTAATTEVISMQDLSKGSERRIGTATMSPTLPYSNENELDPEEDSPYPEVRASVSNYDDVEMPVLTFRSWVLGLVSSVVFASLNCFFNFRYPAPIILPIVVEVTTYPLGKLMAWALPIWEWKTPKGFRWLMGDYMSLNPGPWNIKEHTIIVIMANASSTPGFSLHYTVSLQKFYDINVSIAFDYLLLLSTQVAGFGVAGLFRRYLVWPAELIWPTDLVLCTLLNTLHAEEDDEPAEGEKKSLSRYRFFVYITIGAFVWYFLPGFLFSALSVFNFICWIAPTNVIVNQLFGTSSGLGLSFLTFDWFQISYIGSPLVIPFSAQLNIYGGFVFFFFLVVPLMYYNNVWYTGYLPLMAPSVFDRFGNVYNTTKVFDPHTRALDIAAYESYSPLYLTASYTMTVLNDFAIASAALVHTVLFHGKAIWRQTWYTSKAENEDIHAKLMRNYAEVPESWYLGFWALSFGLSMLICGLWSTGMPLWALLIALVLGWLYLLPGAYIYARTGQTIVINLLAELIAGYAMPGDPIGNMLFKVYSTQACNISIAFAQDLKLGHYMKIPPRATFMGEIAVQIVSIAIATLAQVAVVRWLLATVPDLCAPRQSALLVCPGTTVFHGASVFWGLIGPPRLFSIGRLYSPLLFAFALGGILPIIVWLLDRKFPNRWIQYVNVPVLLTGVSYAPPATGLNYTSFAVVGFIFQYLLRRFAFRTWSKYNFLLSAALDSGTILSAVFIFVTLQLPKGGSIALNWWGNEVYTKTADWTGVSWLTPPAEGFGPSTWSA